MKFTSLSPELYEYILDHTHAAHPLLPLLAEETKRMPMAQMQISADQGALLHFLAKTIGAKRALEVGCFTGYSAIAVASALPHDGKLITLDISEEYTDVAQKYFREAGLADVIELRLGPALESLAQLERNEKPGSFDFAFIDADKSNYEAYFESAWRLVRTGGLILIDNVLWSGSVVDPRNQEPDTLAIRAFNDKLHQRVGTESVMTSISDGITLVRKSE